MRNLTPEFVLEAVARGATHGSLQAVTLFADVSGFTPLTTRFMQYGSEGAEVLSDVLAALFEPLIAAVETHGGVVVGYAGDAFKAIFPLAGMPAVSARVVGGRDAYAHATAAAWAIVQRFRTQPAQATRFGAFDFSGKVCLADGAVEWRLLGTERPLAAAGAQRAAIVFGGAAIAACMQLDSYAGTNEIVASASFYARLNPQAAANWTAVEAAWRLEHLPTLALAKSPAHRPPALTAEASAVAYAIFPPDVLDSPVAGEFRRVVTLFINCAQDAAELDRLHFPDLLFELLDQYGGFLCRIGRAGSKDDGLTLLVFFGAPKGQEHDVAQALHFALQLQSRAPGSLRAGITTSLAFAGFVGSSHLQEYTCHGPLVNLAARLMNAAPPGALWLDAATVRSAGPGWDVEPLGEQPFKGFAEPQPVFALHGHSIVSRFYVGDLVGRTRELQALQAAAQPLWQGQNGGLALVVGEAGLGKSRLVHTFQDHTQLAGQRPTAGKLLGSELPDGEAQLAQWFVCQTDEIVRAPFNPFRYWLRQYFHQQVSYGAANQLALTGQLDELIATAAHPELAADLERARAPLAALLDLPVDDPEFEQLDARLRFDNTLNAVKTLILAESLRRPVILLIEDGQWLDEESKTLLGWLLDNAEDFPLLVIVAARPEAEFADDITPMQWLPESVSLHLLRLAPLADSDLAALVRVQLGGQPAPRVADFLAEQSEGFPFFLEQLLLYLKESNLLVATPNGWDFTPEGAAQRESLLPGDVRSVLTARLDRLPLDVRLAVQTAGVLGREFDTRVLGHMLDDAPDLPQLLAAADAAGIWTRMAEARYLFRHSLLREAAYDMQLRTRLRRLHLRATHAIETVYAADLGPQYAALVYHSNRAEAFDKERSYAHLAGSYAADHYANSEAVRFFSRAIELIPAGAGMEHADPFAVPRLTYDVLAERERVYDLLGRRAEQAADLDQLEALATQLANSQLEAQSALRRSQFALAIGDYATASAAADRCAALARNIGDAGGEAAALLQLGQVLLRQGDLSGSLARMEQAYPLAQTAGDRSLQADTLHGQAMAHVFLGNFDEAQRAFEAALAEAVAVRDRRLECILLNRLSWVPTSRNEFMLAAHYAEQALDLSREIGDRMTEANALNNLGNAYIQISDYARGEEYSQQALDLYRSLGDPAGEGAVLDNLGNAYWGRGEFVDALRYKQQALEIIRRIGDRQTETNIVGNLGIVATDMGDTEVAHAYLLRALELALEDGNRWVESAVSAHLAVASLRLGSAQDAIRYAQASYDLAIDLSAQRDAVNALNALGSAYLELGDPIQALDVHRREEALAQEAGLPDYAAGAIARQALAFLELNDLPQAKERVEIVLEVVHRLTPNTIYAPADIFLACVRVLRAAGDARADEVLDMAYTWLQERLDRLSDASHRTAFIDNIPAHAVLMQEWRNRQPSKEFT